MLKPNKNLTARPPLGNTFGDACPVPKLVVSVKGVDDVDAQIERPPALALHAIDRREVDLHVRWQIGPVRRPATGCAG